ncbi:virion protein [Turkeypox virus]|uniref:Virion protein n=1 Tax=Turkeypox virus TaxID=336486 RepID=A0A0M3ZHK8_9POXV|nr:virion protein [Turkeypox virus]ALA62485.1 virion protein [Turkeypox virus]
MEINLIHVYDVLNNNIVFQWDIDNILNKNYIVVSYSNDGKLHAIYNFEKIARFDSGNIYQQVKYVYKNNKKYLDILFPSKDILNSFNEEIAVHVENTSLQASNQCHPKMVLLELFNSFKANKPLPNYYYYTRL